MYWLVLSTFFWTHTFGQYASETECLEAAKHEPWYVTTRCVPVPEPVDHKH